MSPHPRYHPTADVTQPQISSRSRFHPAPDFTPRHVLPHPRFHPPLDFTARQISPHPRYHLTPDFMVMEVSHFARFQVFPDQLSVQIQRPTKAAARPDSTPRRKSVFSSIFWREGKFASGTGLHLICRLRNTLSCNTLITYRDSNVGFLNHLAPRLDTYLGYRDIAWECQSTRSVVESNQFNQSEYFGLGRFD